MQKRVLSLLVDNTAGVTTRVSGLFSRRGYNIDSITGGVTADERFSRITVVCSGDAGVYGMAGLVYELRGESETPEIVVVGGLTAACTGAALLGAPLTHDFALISLSGRTISAAHVR